MGKQPSKTLQVFAENLTRLISAHKELNTEPKLAAKAKVDQKTIYRITHQQNEPSLDKVEKIAKAFGLQPWQLLVPNLAPNAPPELVANSEERATLAER